MSSRWGIRTLRIVAFLGVTLAAPLLLGAGTNTWDGGGTDNNWSTALNWNPDGIPLNDGTASVEFDESLRLTPYVDVPWVINSLVFKSAAGASSIHGSPLTVGAGGIVNLSSSIPSPCFLNDLILSAPQKWEASGSGLRFLGNAANSGHLLTIAGYSTTAVYGNITGSGGLVKGGTGTLELRGVGPVWYAGPTSVTGGTLSLLGITAWTAPFTVDSGAALSFGGGVHEFKAGATVSGAGAASFTAGMVTFNDTFNLTGTKTFSGGTVNFNGPVSGLGPTLSMSGGGVNFTSNPVTFTTVNLNGSASLGGSADLIVSGTFAWSDGTMTGTGTTEIPAGATLTMGAYEYLARTINNRGTAASLLSPYTYNLYSTTGGSGAVFNNLPGGMFDLQQNTGLSGTTSAVFNNEGTFRKSAGTGTAGITSAWTFNNKGLLEVLSGGVSVAGPFNNTGTVSVGVGRTLTLSGGGTSSGTFIVDSAATLAFSGGTHVLASTVAGSGNVSFSGGTVTFTNPYTFGGATSFGGGTINFNAPVSGLGPTLTVSGGSVNFNYDPMIFATVSMAGGLGGSANITISDRLNWTSGTMSGTGLTEIPVGRTLALSGSSAKYLARTVNNSGGATLAGSNLSSTSGGLPIFNNLVGATFDVQADYGLAGTDTATFNNVGTFKKSAGTGTSSITSAWTFNNSGTFDVQSGTVSAAGPFNNTGTVTVGVGRTLTLSGGGASSGAFVLGNGATLQFTGGENAFNAGVTVTGGAMILSGGVLRFDGASVLSSPVTFSGGTWAGSETVTTAALSWTGGTMTGFGTTDIPTGSSLALSGSSAKYLARTVNNSGGATLAGSNLSSTSGGLPIFNNLVGATFDVQADYGLAGTDTATFNNVGTFKKSAGTGTSSITSAWTFNNSGTFDVQSGTVSVAGLFNNTGTVTVGVGRTLTLTGGGTSSGPFTVANGATLEFGGGTHVLDAGASITGGGRVLISGTPTVYFNGPVSGLPTNLTIGGNLYFNSNAVSFATISQATGTLGGSAKVTVTGQMNWTGGTMTGSGSTDIPTGASLVISGTSAKYLARTVNNSGAATLAGSSLSSTSGGAPVFNNLAGATFDVQADYGLAGTDTATFNNAGTFKKSAGNGTSSITNAWTFNNTGTFDLQGGSLSVAGPFNSSGTVTVGVGRTLTLSGGGTSSGPFVLKSNAVLQFGGGDHVLNTGATVSGWGSVTVSDGTVTLNDLCNPTGGLTVSGGTVNLNAPSGLGGMPIRLSGGTLASNAALTNNSSMTGFGTIGGAAGFTNNSSVLGNGGALVLSNSGPNVNAGTLGLGAGLQLVLAGGALTNMGSIDVNSGLIMGASALTNSVGGIISGTGMIQTPFSNAGGTLRSSTGSLNVQQAFSSAGLIEVQNGGGLTGGGITNTGVVQGSGSVANAIVNQGQIECTAGTLFLGGAVTNTATGSISAATGGKVVVTTAASENQGAVSLDGGEVRFNQPLVNAKSGRIAGRGRYLFSGGLTNWGQMQFSGGVADVFGAIGLVGGATGGKIINSGSGNLVTFYDDVTHNGAEIRTSSGNTSVFFGNVSGAGNFTGTGTVQFEGGYSPGNSPAAVGFEGDAMLGSESRLRMELAGRERGAQYDWLLVSGLMVLDGALDVTLLGGYQPRPGDSFDLLDWGTLAGTFDSVSLPALGAGMAWDTTTLYDSGTITVAPEPATLALVLVGVAGTILRRRRR